MMEGETIYNSHDDSHIVMSEKVQSLAGSVYQEFERMISKYDENVVKDLMPLVVNILECLDLAYTENQEHEVEVELLREDNEQLVTQYEREKQLRKTSEQKLLELEDVVEEDRKKSQAKVESLESIVRMFDLKNKNASDHATRMEDKVDELKQDYTKLHDRYTELFKTHMDYMERTKILMGTDRLEQMGSARGRLPDMNLSNMNSYIFRSSGPVSFGFSSLDPDKSISSPVDMSSSANGTLKVSSLKNELQEAQVGPDTPVLHTDREGGWVDGFTPEEEMIQTSPELEDIEDISMDPSIGPDIFRNRMKSSTTTHKEERTGNNLYQELQFQEPDALAEVDEGADITGMGKEVENLIQENNELLATKNALNIVKDDLIAKVDELISEQQILREEIQSLNAVKSRLRLRVTELEDELKKIKEETEKNSKANKSDDEDVPMAQRKRFTRVEMARVLMERNQYKERFMELQEAVRWTEMIRATRNDPSVDKKNKQTIWKFFSNLFSTSEKPIRKPLPYGNVRYNANATTHQVTPALDTMRRRNIGDHRRKGLDLFDPEFSSEKLQQRRANERREQYRQVRAHVKKDDGRMQAYGWSLPVKTNYKAIEGPPSQSESPRHSAGSGGSSHHVPVPVPVYCRPLMEKEPGMKIWCAAGVNLTGGRTRDGGSIVGASVFYSGDTEVQFNAQPSDDVDKLDMELMENEKDRKQGELLEQTLSSLVWICTSTHSISKVTVIDANNPADILESFHVCSSHLLCIASVPGAKESDYTIDEDLSKLVEESEKHKSSHTVSYAEDTKEGDNSGADGTDGRSKEEMIGSVGTLSFINCATGSSAAAPDSPLDKDSEEIKPVLRVETISCTDPDQDEDRAEVSEGDGDSGPTRILLKEPEGIVKDGVEEADASTSQDVNMVREQVEKMSSVLATMWLGSQSGSIYVHSAVRQWKRCLHSIKLKDSVLSIVHIKGRVLAALADGTIAIFHRRGDGQWDLTNYHLLDLGKPHHSIRCMHAVHNKVWCGYRNKIHVIDPKTMSVEKSFDAHPRKESQVRQMAWIGDGVWVSIRLDSTLRLYHAHTYQHLQDVDIEPYVSKMLEDLDGREAVRLRPNFTSGVGDAGTGKLGFSFVRITALLISSLRLWIGTGNGVIISVPLSDLPASGSCSGASGGLTPTPSNALVPVVKDNNAVRMPGGVVRVYADNREQLTPGSYIPFCTMAHAQLSFHGHRDAVKFFVAVPGSGGYNTFTVGSPTGSTSSKERDSALDGEEKPKSMLVISGGEGYIDFRIADEKEEDCETSSHLLVWHIPMEDNLAHLQYQPCNPSPQNTHSANANGPT